MNTATVFTTVFAKGTRHQPTLKTKIENTHNYTGNGAVSKNTPALGLRILTDNRAGYAKAQHGFHNDSTSRYSPKDAELAWQRTIAFFKQHFA